MPSVLLNRVRQERWSTRVYLVLLFAAFFVLALYKGL